MESKMNFTVIIYLTIGLMLLPFSIVMGQENEEHVDEFSKLLEGENKRDFFASTKSGSFGSNFGSKEKLESHGNDIWIKLDNNIVIEGTLLREYGTILIEGDLTIIKTGDFPLKVQKIIVAPSGKLTIGTNETPIEKNKKAEIVFVKNQPGEVGIFVFGELSIHGYNIGTTFVELTSDAKPGQEILAVAELVKNWQRQSKILITSPGIHQDFETCTEENEINRIDGIFIYLKEPLECFHQGFNNDNEIVSSHVAILDRNIVIKSDELKNRGSVNFFHGSQGEVKYAEFRDLGPKNVLGRYPIHFHHMQDTSRGIEVEGNSVLNSDNRWITIHNSNGIVVKNNVGYNAIGHGFFLEAGNEFDNVFDHNIGIKTLRGNLISSDGQAAVFWSMNPMNSYTNNVAVDGWYYGYDFNIPSLFVVPTDLNEKINLRSLSNLDFENNIAYNNRVAGLKIDRTSLSDESLPAPTITISNFKVWNEYRKDGSQWGILVRADDVIIRDSKIFDSTIGIELGRDDNLVQNTKIKITHDAGYPLISGIMISGQNNTIIENVVEGYYVNDLSSPSDISISNSHTNLKPISGAIINSELMGPNPIYFGNPVNSQSYLEVYGYEAPNGPKNNYPENFLLQKIGRSNIEESNIDLNFFATIEPLHADKQLKEQNLLQNFEKETLNFSNEEIIQQFKNKALAWDRDVISDEEFLAEINVLINEEIIKLSYVDLDDFNVIDLEIPIWIKQLVNYWLNNSITNQEFFNAIEFIFQSQINNEYFSFKYS